MCDEGAKKIAEVVDHFSVEFQKDQDVLDTLSCITQLDSQADKVNASRRNNTKHVQLVTLDAEWSTYTLSCMNSSITWCSSIQK